MKQVLQQVSGGEIEVVDVPTPRLLAGCVLVRTAASLVSVGTERASSEFARKNLLQKARMRPDLVRDVWNKVSRDGVASALAAVRSRMDQPSTPGYSSAGTVVAVGEGITDIRPGDRVACAGVGHAVHAEFACIPRLLLAQIPPGSRVGFDHAAATTVGAVALHGIRTADVKLGDIVAVIGLGLLGQLTVQILKASGCRVLGMDIDPGRVDLALRLGADAASASSTDFFDVCMQESGGRGVDAVLLAAQTISSDPVNLAAEVARDRAVIVAVGAVGMALERRTFYEKELDFRLSRSYGPGRYDAAYEQKGVDYPIGYVRWTETRNMQAFLQLLAEGKVDVGALITHRFPIDRAQSAYDLIMGKSQEAFLGVLITYPDFAEEKPSTVEGRASCPSSRWEHPALHRQAASDAAKTVAIGLLGAGNFATSTLLPAMKRVGGLTLVGVCAANGSHSHHTAQKFGFRYSATDENQLIADTAVNTVVIATRHHLHARQVLAALKSGKHVFCEKPLCLNEDELRDIVRFYQDRQSAVTPLLMVGFNRRFAPLALRLKSFLRGIHEPLALHYRVNAGFIPADHWLNDPEQGGGRLIGEVCHFVDFLSFLVGAQPVEAQAHSLANPGKYSNDNVVCSLRFADGSQGTISYLANGDKSYSKERLEVFGAGAVAVLEDFRRLELVRRGRKKVFRSFLRQDKGHRGEWDAFVAALRAVEDSPIPLAEIVTTMLATFALEESRSSGQPVPVRGFQNPHFKE